MSVFETFRIAVTSLLLNRMRALLTMLGIVIGVAAVISLMSLGRGVESLVADQFNGLGADILTVRASSPQRGFSSATNPLTDVNVEAIADPAIIPSVAQVAADYQVQGTVVKGYVSTSATVRGVTANFFGVNDWHPSSGSTFTIQDINTQAQIALLGTTMVEDVFGSETYDPIGESILINGRSFTVVGVMTAQTATGFNDPNSTILVPITTAQAKLGNARIAGAGYTVSSIMAKVSDLTLIDQATDEIEAYLLEEHGIVNEAQADFSVSSPSNAAESRTEVLGTLTLFLSGIAAISLLVGGIGVMNIMMVSVSERTREIGLRKAVGARAGDILSQFLIESLLLSLIGGAVGIGFGWGIASLASGLIGITSLTMSPDVVLLAVGVSVAIGVFFGLYPANRAARMHPIQALRFE